ncbi:MAG: hypothetical protein H0Z34_14680 [Brevibacillus sp.]|nr:hypothetical protein [Brevibacillus sp.]
MKTTYLMMYAFLVLLMLSSLVVALFLTLRKWGLDEAVVRTRVDENGQED